MIKSDIVSIIKNIPVIALAVSGGSDSMAMAEWFRLNRPKDTFVILNIDHGIRGEESKRDSDFVKDYAKKHGIKYYFYQIDAAGFSKQNGYTLEQGARILRHQIFEQACMEYAYAVATAHHQSDQVESVFMHIARGTGLNGLIGMNVQDGHIIRPLIHTSKEQIMQFIADNNIEYCEDSTNQNQDYSRNYTRNVVLPTIKQKYPNFDKSILKLSERARELADFVDLNTPSLLVEDNCVKCDFDGKHNVIKAEMIKRAFSLLGINVDIEQRHIDLILRFYQSEKKGKLDMPFNTSVYKENGNIVIAKNFEYDKVEYPFSEGIFEIGGYEVLVQTATKYQKDDFLYVAVDDFEKVVLRTKQTGDQITQFGGGSKSLGDFFTDKKIPLRLRERVPIVCSGNQVLCVCGVDIAKQAQVKKESKKIFKIKIIN